MNLGMWAETVRGVHAAFLRRAFARRRKPVQIVEGQFTDEEAIRIAALRRQYLAYPDSFSLDVDYRRIHFVRWLVQQGNLREAFEGSEGAGASVESPDKWAQIRH